MTTPSQTTEFSAHLSWAGMRRYLQEALSAEKSQRVERHLHHCPRCSSAIVDYIQAEEPEHYKQYTKKLKGILKTGQAEKKNVLSSFQMKAVRTTTAVVTLLIFSFFALRTVINKQVNYPLPATSLAVAEKSEKVAPVHRSPVKKVARVTTDVRAAAKAESAKVVKKAAVVPQKEAPSAEAPTVITKARTTKAPKTVAVAVANPVPQNQPRIESSTKDSDVSTNKLPLPTAKEEAPLPQEEVVEASDNDTARRKPLPTLQKIDALQSAAAVTPLGESSPTEMPVPSNEILER